MSNLGFLEKLLDGAAVDWVPIAMVTLPTSNIKWREVDGTVRYIDLTSVDIKTRTITETKEITADTAPSRAQKLVETDDLIFATTRPTQQRYCLIGSDFSEDVASTGYCVLRVDQAVVLPKWLLHWIGSREFKQYVEEHQSGAAYPAISDGKVKAFQIPIPCPDNPEKSLAIQAEIVRVLDAFTELTAELTARRKQYKHYRDKLLTFDGGDVEWKPLGEVAEVRSGWGFPKTYQGQTEGDYPFYKVSDMNIHGNQTVMVTANNYVNDLDIDNLGIKPAPEGTVIFPKIGAAIATNKKRILSKPSAYDNNVMGLIPGEDIKSRFLFYWMQTIDLSSLAHDSGAVPSIRKSVMEAFQIPIPSLAEQARIVAILDKFATITTSLSEGLPREIDLRQKQYAYYRDLLLDFPKPDREAA